MQFKDNFSEMVLLSETEVIFYYENQFLKDNVFFTMKLLPIKDSLTNPYIQNAIAYFALTPQQLREKTKLSQAHNLWSFLNIADLSKSNPVNRSIAYYFNFVFGEQFSNEKGVWKINNLEITEELFNRIQDITLVVSGMKKFSEQSIFQMDKPSWLLEKEAEIARIKNGKKGKVQKNHFEELMKTFLPLNYELGYSLEELFNMNYFHVQYLSKYIPKIVGYDLQKRQIMSKKKIKYITEN